MSTWLVTLGESIVAKFGEHLVDNMLSFIRRVFQQMRKHPWRTTLIALLIFIVCVVIFVSTHILLFSPLIYVENVKVSVAYSQKRVEPSIQMPQFLETNKKTLYVTDNGRLLSLPDCKIIPLRNTDDEALIVRIWGSYLFVLVRPSDSVEKLTLVRITLQNGDVMERSERQVLYTFPENEDITDFIVSEAGNIWFVKKAMETIGTEMKIRFRLGHLVFNDNNPDYHNYYFENHNKQDNSWPLVEDVPEDNNPKLAFDMNGNLYVSLPEDHMILKYSPGQKREELSDRPSVFAGDVVSADDVGDISDGQDNRVADESDQQAQSQTARPGFRDKTENAFWRPVKTALYRPTSLVADNDYLYVLDYNTVRRFSLEDGSGETLAGSGKPQTGKVTPQKEGETVSGKEAVFSAHNLATLTLDNNGDIFLSNPANGVIYRVHVNTP